MTHADAGKRPLVEVCLETVTGCIAAETGGADRIELCADLLEGGTTPSAGRVRLARQSCSLPLMVMIRPRGGDFLYDASEREEMAADIEILGAAGVAGVVLGLLTPEGLVDGDATAPLVERARSGGLEVTFHRAFDMSRDLSRSLEDLVALGVDRVLTSGGRASVVDALPVLAELVEQAGERLIVMPGCGVMEDNIARVARQTRCREIHFAAPARVESGMRHRNAQVFMGTPAPPGEYETVRTDAERVKRFLAALG